MSNEQKSLDEQGITIGAVIGVIAGGLFFDSFSAIAGSALLGAFIGPALISMFKN
jgi:hypothetical protein